MQRPAIGLLLAFSLLTPAAAQVAPAHDRPVFSRIATIEAVANLPAGRDRAGRSIAEIVAASGDGMTLVYVDGEQKGVGFIDISDPAAPRAAGFVALEGEATSVATLGGRAFVMVDTSPDKRNPSGVAAVLDIASRRIEGRCDLGGQPDAAVVSRDGRFLVVAIENERDESLDRGRIPQLPAGTLAIIPLAPAGIDCGGLRHVDLTGLAAVAPEDPEPEFVDANGRGEAVVTLQENNHLAVIDIASGRVLRHFPAGSVTVGPVDARRDGLIRPTQTLENVRREPDAVKWLDDTRVVTANEGDYQGGSRGFSIFDTTTGAVEFDSGALTEHIAIRLGHFPDRRAGNRGAEPEGIEVGQFGDDRLIFVGLERASLVLVFLDQGPGRAPEFLQALPAPVGPEGLLAIPARGLFVAAGEVDNPGTGLRSALSIYRLGPGPARYPTILSENGPDGLPIGWGALSGLAADRLTPGRLFAVTDSFYAEARILTIDANGEGPARIVSATTVTENGAPAAGLDIEGIAVRPGGGFWLVSEGNPERQEGALPSRLLRVSAAGAIEEDIRLPEVLAAAETRFGFEGVAVTGEGERETVVIAVQREWRDDPRGRAKILLYRVADRRWGVLHYPLGETPRGWMGLSEIVSVDDETFMVIERNNGWGADAIKHIAAFSIAGLKPAEPGASAIPVVTKRLVRDVVPDLASTGGIVLEKLEGLTIDAGGNVFAVTDNDGVDGTSGETQFIRLGRAGR